MAVVGVCSPKGGGGATTVAVNLAISLAGDATALLMDLNPLTGSGDLYLGVEVEDGWQQLLTWTESLSYDVLLRAAVRHSSGLLFLGAPSNGGVLGHMRQLCLLIHHLSMLLRWVVLDVPHTCLLDSRFSKQCMDILLLVATSDPASVRATSRCLQVMRQVGYVRPMLILNQASRSMLLSPEQLAERLEVDVLGVLPGDRPAASMQLYCGLPLATGSGIRMQQRFEQMGSKLCRLFPDEGEGPSRSRGLHEPA